MKNLPFILLGVLIIIYLIIKKSIRPSSGNSLPQSPASPGSQASVQCITQPCGPVVVQPGPGGNIVAAPQQRLIPIVHIPVELRSVVS